MVDMKIAIASDDENNISSHFGRTKIFQIFEVRNNTIFGVEKRFNTFTGHATGLEDAGHEIDRHVPILSALKDCDVVISHGMGRRIYNDLKGIGIKVFITEKTDVKEVLDLYISGKLINRPEMGCSHKH